MPCVFIQEHKHPGWRRWKIILPCCFNPLISGQLLPISCVIWECVPFYNWVGQSYPISGKIAYKRHPRQSINCIIMGGVLESKTATFLQRTMADFIFRNLKKKTDHHQPRQTSSKLAYMNMWHHLFFFNSNLLHGVKNDQRQPL